MFSDSFAPEFGPKQAHGYKSREDVLLLKAVLQDSINLLDQVGWSALKWRIDLIIKKKSD